MKIYIIIIIIIIIKIWYSYFPTDFCSHLYDFLVNFFFSLNYF